MWTNLGLDWLFEKQLDKFIWKRAFSTCMEFGRTLALHVIIIWTMTNHEAPPMRAEMFARLACVHVCLHWNTLTWANRHLYCLSFFSSSRGNEWGSWSDHCSLMGEKKKLNTPICSPQLQQMWPVLKAAKSWSIGGWGGEWSYNPSVFWSFIFVPLGT